MKIFLCFIFLYLSFQIFAFLYLRNYRDTIMAAASGGSDPERARSRCPLPLDIPRHHRIEAAHRHRRQQRRSDKQISIREIQFPPESRLILN